MLNFFQNEERTKSLSIVICHVVECRPSAAAVMRNLYHPLLSYYICREVNVPQDVSCRQRHIWSKQWRKIKRCRDHGIISRKSIDQKEMHRIGEKESAPIGQNKE
jgi:hypothetical protein